MRFFRLVLFALFCVPLFWAYPVRACSCITQRTIPEKVDATPYIFHGRVKKRRWSGVPFFSNKKTTFEVIKKYKGDLKTRVIVYHSKDLGGNCGIDFGYKEELLVFAYQQENGKLSTGSCAFHSLFSDQQFIEYFEKGLDSSALTYICILYINDAYAEENKTGKFNLVDKKCLAAKSLYDRLYRKKD